MLMQCQEEYLPGQILQKHVMQCWFLPVLCQSQGIKNCYNHCLSTFVDPWFILTNWRILVDHGSNHIVILIDFLHPPVTWHLFPVSTWVRSNVFQSRCQPKGRGWIPGARHYPLVQCLRLPGSVGISVGILLVILIGDSHWFSHFHPFPQGFPWISEDFPALARGWPMLSFRTGRKSNKGHCSLNSETVRLDCAFTNLYEL